KGIHCTSGRSQSSWRMTLRWRFDKHSPTNSGGRTYGNTFGSSLTSRRLESRSQTLSAFLDEPSPTSSGHTGPSAALMKGILPQVPSQPLSRVWRRGLYLRRNRLEFDQKRLWTQTWND